MRLGDSSSVWYGSTLRGDQSSINVGKNSVIQDLVSLVPRNKGPISVGDNVYIGPNTTLESCTIENNAFIGMGATVRSGAKVESYGVVAAGAVVPEGATVPAYQVIKYSIHEYLIKMYRSGQATPLDILEILLTKKRKFLMNSMMKCKALLKYMLTVRLIMSYKLIMCF